MLFTSWKFIVFMAAVFLLYYIIPKKKQWWLLLAASYFFYAFSSPVYLLFLGFTTAVTYAGGVAMDRTYREQKQYLNDHPEISKDEKKEYREAIRRSQKLKVAAVVTVLLLMLGIFKYADFFSDIVVSLLSVIGVSVQKPSFNLILPIGLSFYVFQSIGYCVDVYREMVETEHNFFRHALYVSYFPQILQGPIGSYSHLSPQLFEGHEFDYEKAKLGIERVAWGFFKKLVIANQIAGVIDSVWTSYVSYSGLLFWCGALCLYSIQLYADFSGYMDIALGCSRMLGIEMEENFNVPYLSRNVAEFWRKWHISLGAWFKNYVFYPLLRTKLCDGIRKKYRKGNQYISSTIPNVIALLIVWTMIGLWHGADWSYVVYGLYHGLFVISSTVLAPVYNKVNARFPGKQKSRAYLCFEIVRTFIIVTFGYVVFRPADLSATLGILRQMTAGSGFRPLKSLVLNNFRVLVAAGMGTIILFFSDVYQFNHPGVSFLERINEQKKPVRWIIFVVFLLFILFCGSYGVSGVNEFAYFRF